jgi:hypothetical protein
VSASYEGMTESARWVVIFLPDLTVQKKSTLRGLFEMLETYSNLDNQADIQSLLHIEC